MPSSLVDLVKISVNSTGTGAITLGTAVEGYRGREVLTNGTVYSYSIQQDSAWEFGRGTYLSEGRQIVRSVIDSSDGGTPIGLKVGATIAFTALSGDLMPTTQLTDDVQAKVSAAELARAGAETAQDLSEGARDIAVAKAGEAAVSAAAAQAWASGTEPGGPGTKSALEWVGEAAAQVALLQDTQTIGRPAGSTLVTGAGAASAGTYVFANALIFDATGNSSLRLWTRSSASQTIKLRRYTVSGGTATPVSGSTWVSVTVPAGPGAFAIDTTAAGFLAGEAVGISKSVAFLAYATGTTGDSGGYYTTATVDADAFTASLVTNIQLQIGIDMPFQYVTTEGVKTVEADVLAAQVAATASLSALGDLGEQTSVIVEDHSATTQFAGVAFGGWAGVVELDDAPVGTVIRRMGIDGVFAATGATKINLKVYTRANSETAAPPTNCTLVFSQDYALASLGITAGDTNRKSIDFEFPSDFVKVSGHGLAYRWEAQDGASAKIASSSGYLTDAAASASERGWYYSTTTSPSYTAMTSPNRLAIRLYRDGYVPFQKSDLAATADADISVSGTTVSVAGTVRKNGTDYPFSGSLTLSLAASGKERMDKIVVDRSTLAVTAVSGSSRDVQLDALEWQGATPSNAIVVGRARVTNTTITAVSTANFTDLVKVGTEAEMAILIERNRRILRKVIGKAIRGGTIKLGGYGDSITAFQSSTPTFAANGTMRDRGRTYLANYPADSLALVPVYDTGDGAGAVHTRLGWNWKIKAALEDLGGVVTYNNYGIGGTTSQSTANNGLDPARIAVPLADALDVVVIAFGMNERGQSYSYANVLSIISQFRAVGTACIVMGCPRPNANQSVAAWRMTNDQLEAAALDGGAAFVSTVAIADDRNLGGIGVPAEALASANTITGGNNHPGIWELTQYGDSAVIQLGLS